MDPIYSALFLFERREFQECADVCTDILEKDPYDEMIWSLKTRALTGTFFQSPLSLSNQKKKSCFETKYLISNTYVHN